MSAPQPDRVIEFIRNLGRLWLYLGTFVFLGALAVPLIRMNRRIGRGEKAFLCIMGVLQTAAAVALFAAVMIWVWRMMSGITSTGGPQNPFGL